MYIKTKNETDQGGKYFFIVNVQSAKKVVLKTGGKDSVTKR